MKRNFYIKRVVIILVVIMTCLFGCEEILRRGIGGFAGSYPFAETWDLNAREADVIDVIKDLKTEDSKLQPPNEAELTSKGDTTNELDYWLYINFYYKDTKQIVHTWTRPSLDSTHTTFALVSFANLNDSLSEKMINKDFWYF